MEKTSASAPKKMRKLKDFSDGNKKNSPYLDDNFHYRWLPFVVSHYADSHHQHLLGQSQASVASHAFRNCS